MEFRFSREDESFRARVRAFLGGWTDSDGQVPASRKADLENEMAAQKWLTIAWPVDYGGAGASPLQQLIFKEECWRVGFSSSSQGVNLIGPALMVHGTEEQKLEHLPRIASGEVQWAQGFSEPGAGSDLASLQTRAVRDGDDYIINGQKIWTSEAHHSDWIHLLARTDPEAPKHRGISYFMIDLRTPGITIRPLIQLTGVHGFNEVFFDDVRVPRKNMISGENRGWYAATTTLDFERSGIERNLVAQRDWERLYDYAKTNRAALAGRNSMGWRANLADLRIEVEVGQWIARRVAWMQGHGLVPNYESSMSKTYNSELGQRIADFGVGLLGLTGQSREPSRLHRGVVAFRYLDARRLTIGQGTSEINRNVIATRGLGLPRG